MKEQTILQCAKCLNHTPLLETDSAESIMEAIKKHNHCLHCGHYVMLCFESKPVIVGKIKKFSWRSQNAPAIKPRVPKLRRGNKKPQARQHDKQVLLQEVQQQMGGNA